MAAFRRLALVVGALAIAVVASPSAQQRDAPVRPIGATVRVHGRVIAADTGEPVRSANVTFLTAPSIGAWPVITDENGTFDLRDLPSAVVGVIVSKPGFLQYSMKFGDKPLAPGQTIACGEIRLRRGAVIAGRVVDAFGDPVQDAAVQVSVASYPEPGVRRARFVRSSLTNDLGEYRFWSLPAG